MKTVFTSTGGRQGERFTFEADEGFVHGVRTYTGAQPIRFGRPITVTQTRWGLMTDDEIATASAILANLVG